MNERERNFLEWEQDGGPEKMIAFQGIGKDSYVFDIGLYKGWWSEQIYSRYGCILYGFEPIWQYFEEARNRLTRLTSRVNLFNYGVGGHTRSEYIALLGDSSSIFRSHNNKYSVTIKSIKEILENLRIGFIDLTSINIEGGEYELLESLTSSGLIKRFDQLLIQFHRIGPDYSNRKAKIQEALSRTHFPLYKYEYIWELWKSNE